MVLCAGVAYGDCVSSRSRCARASFLLIATVIGATQSVGAAEPAELFLRELKNRGLADVALEYLDRIPESPAVSPDFKDTVAFRQGEVLVQEALRQRMVTRKQSLLDRAQDKFTEFRSQHRDHVLALLASSKLGTIQMERARLLVQDVSGQPADSKRRKESLSTARTLFDQAVDTFQQIKTDLRERLKEIPSDLSAEDDAELLALRSRLRTEYVQAQVVIAMVPFEQALTYDKRAGAREKLLKKSEAEFARIAEKYRRRLAGLTAVLFQGRARQQLGDVRGALAIFEDLLLTLKDSGASLRPLKTRALRGAMECWIDDEVKQYEAARQRGEAWVEGQRPDERTDEDWLAVKLLLAQTYQRIIQSGLAGRQKSDLQSATRRLAIEVAKYRGASREGAEAILASMGNAAANEPSTPSESLEVPKVATFDQALVAARELLSKRQSIAQELLRQNDNANGPDSKSNAKLSADLEAVDLVAIRILVQAQDLANQDTQVAQLNQARYYLATLYYYRGDYFRSAVVSDFLATRFPGSEHGRRAAAISLASLVQLHSIRTSPPDESSSDANVTAYSLHDRLKRTAFRIARQWPGQPEADDALATLISLNLREGKTAEAEEALSQMTEGSPKRAQVELAVGQHLWNQASQPAEAGASDGETAEIRARAITLLQSGIDQLRGSSPDASMTAACLLVAQYLTNQGRAMEAIELLEDPQVGPRTLVDAGHSMFTKPGLRERTYMLSMLAYVSALPQSKDGGGRLVAKALAAMQAMTDDQEVRGQGTSGQRQERLSTTYVILARTLQDQIRTAPATKQMTLVNAFQQFLEQASATTQELSVLNWIADAYVNLAQVSTVGDSRRKFLRKGAEGYQKILNGVRKGEFAMTDQDRLLLQTRLASVYRDQGDYSNAIEQFAGILKQQGNQVYVQFEAAQTLQQWGRNGQSDAFTKAIVGDQRDPKTKRNLFWGYGRISKLVAGKKGLESLFFEARLRMAECRYELGMVQSGQQRNASLAQAERDVQMTARLYPELGGPERKQQFADLLKSIQQANGKDFTGLDS